METFKDSAVLFFESQESWHEWLDKHNAQQQGVWLKLAKKSSGLGSVSYMEALEEALCYGWIDAQKQPYDTEYWLQKFTPRGPKSMWSKVNVAKAEELLRAKRMKPSGLAAMEAAKKSGAWKAAYDSPGTVTIPPDFQVELDKNPKAKKFFETLNKANVYGFCWRIQTAKKPETRKTRIDKFIKMLNNGEKLH
ncbi:MAG: YdeI family protein [Candidatus Kapaibacterium sp.]